MSDDKTPTFLPNQGGVFNDLVLRIKLILRLMADRRVNPLIKLLPLTSALYFIIPDIAPGPIDDVAIVWFGLYLFLEICPPEIVQEHMDMLAGGSENPGRESGGLNNQPGEIIDGEMRDKEL